MDTGSERVMLYIPCGRHARFDPMLIAKYQRCLPGFDDKTIALYAWGVNARDIQAHVEEIYGIGISPELVSAITDRVIEYVTVWQSRPLEATYAVVYIEVLRVKIRGEGLVRNKGGIWPLASMVPAKRMC